MRNSRLAFLFAVVLAVIVSGLWLSRRSGRPSLDPPAVLAQVQQLQQLATVRYTLQKIVGLTEQKQPVGSESILLIMQARVQAGVDLSRLTADSIILKDDGIVMRLPAARILDVAVDEKETRVWDRQKTWWAPWVPYSLDLEQRARQQGLDSVRQAAIDMGILPQAQRNAETSIRALLELAGVKRVTFIPVNAT